MSNITPILQAIESGDDGAAAQWRAMVYDEVRQMAAQQPGRGHSEQTPDATGLVHEAVGYRDK